MKYSNPQDGGRIEIFNENHCAPSKTNIEGSCLDSRLIRKIAKIVNKMIQSDNNISKINCEESTERIHDSICRILKEITGCSSEACWMKIKTIIKSLGKDRIQFIKSFKPIMPEEWVTDYNAWLGTDDIENSLNQHSEKDSSFYFYGAEPIDFSDCGVSELCSFNMKKHMKRNEHKIGVVFNTDPHTEPGQHWISLYMDLKGTNLNGIPGIYYFDSYGYKPGKEIRELIHKVQKQGRKYNNPVKYFYNDKSYQNHDAQCGMYSIHFIKEMLKGTKFRDFLNSGLSDDKMITTREYYFISPNEIKI